MAKKYDVDDILKEVDSLRNDPDKRNSAPVLTGMQKKPVKRSSEKDLSVTQILTDIPGTRSRSVAKQLTEKESEERLRRDISSAFESKKAVRITEERETLSARQLTESEYEARLARDIGNAADVKLYEKNMVRSFDPDTADTAEVDKFSEHVSAFVKPDVAGEDDDIVFHTRGDLVTTETMELRKQQKIDEINRALLKADREAESPEEMLDLINPMESKQRVEDMLKGGDDTDTLTVAGNDLKRIAHCGERVKEYQPAVSRKKEPDDVLFSGAGKQSAPIVGELHVGESIVDALNKKIAEENMQKYGLFKEGEDPDEIKSAEEAAAAAAAEEAEKDEKLEEMKAANELAQKKMRKISDFILEKTSEEELEDVRTESKPAPADDETEEEIDLDDENVIRDRLSRATKGLVSRLIILGALFAATLFVAIVNIANLNVGSLGGIINLRRAPENYLYTHLTIGILSFAACSSVITNGFSRLAKLRPDGDTLCAFAHTFSILALIPYLIYGEYIQRSYSHVYLLVSLGLLCFNTVSKLITVRTAKKNLAFTSKEGAKYFVERCDNDGAKQLAKGYSAGIPVIASMRKTEMLYDFIVSTYCEDASDRILGKTSVAALIASIIGGVVAFFVEDGGAVKNIPWDKVMLNKLSWGVTVMTAILCLAAAFSCSMIVTVQLLAAANKGKSKKFALLGYGAVEEFSETNAVLLDAKTLFPPSAIKITNICGYNKPRNRGEGRVNVDEAIIYAASLAVSADSVMSDAFFNMLGYKQELLKPVSGIVYENNLGVMGWIDRRRVLLGNRAHMKAHEISVPNVKKEMAANVNDDEVIYLAVGGEVCLLFFAAVKAEKEVQACVDDFAERGVSLIIKTVDGMITSSFVADLFNIDERTVRIIPFENHDCFNNHTKFTSRGCAALCCDGTLTAFTGAIKAAKSIRSRVTIGSIMQLFGVSLGVLLALVFMIFSKYDMFNEINILLYNIIWAALTIGVQLCGGLIEKLFDRRRAAVPHAAEEYPEK